MPQVIYNGGIDAVDVPAFGLTDVKRGESVDVTDEEATALCVSPDWSLVAPTPPQTKPKADAPPVVTPAPAPTDAPTPDAGTSDTGAAS